MIREGEALRGRLKAEQQAVEPLIGRGKVLVGLQRKRPSERDPSVQHPAEKIRVLLGRRTHPQDHPQREKISPPQVKYIHFIAATLLHQNPSKPTMASIHNQPITEIQISLTKEQEDKLERAGFTKVPGDLNSGTSGPLEFLWYRRGTSRAVTRIQFSFMEEMNEGLTASGFTLINKNINTGTSGNPIFLWYLSCTTQFDSPILDLKVTTKVEEEPELFLNGWERMGLDLNRNAGGHPVYVWLLRDTTTYICSITAALSFSEDRELFQQGYVRMDEDTNRGAFPIGSAVFPWFRQSKIIGEGITEIDVSLNKEQEFELQAKGFTKVDKDLNEGANGDPVYLWYMHSQAPAIQFLTVLVGDVALSTYKRAEVCNVVEKNLNSGNNGVSLYVAYKRQNRLHSPPYDSLRPNDPPTKATLSRACWSQCSESEPVSEWGVLGLVQGALLGLIFSNLINAKRLQEADSVCVLGKTLCTSLAESSHGDLAQQRLSPPLDIQLQTVNCTAIRVQWKMPRRHVSTITGYRVFYTETRMGRPISSTVTLDVPLSLDMLTTDVVIGKLKVATHYRVSVGAYGWAGDGRPSMPRDISTASHEICLPPSPPSQPIVAAVSDTELALSWQQGESEGSAPVLHFLVAYIRPEMDTEWTYIREPVESSSMVLKGLIPETEYQFVIRAVNTHGVGPPSPINPPVRTLGAAEVGSGDSDLYVTSSKTKDEDGFGVDDSDYDVFIEELKPFPAVKTSNRRSQLRSRTGTPGNGNVIYRMRTLPVPKSTPAPRVSNFTSPISVWTLATTSGPSALTTTGSTTTPTSTVTRRTSPAPSTTASLTPSPSMTVWKGAEPRVYDVPCDETVCPPNSFCINDYDSGGSRCHCNLGHQGELCAQGVSIQFPKFYGYSHMTFEPLKNSYQSFQITVEFKADSEDGLLLYCGENDHGRGDFTSLALIRGKLHYRFNCGTGAAQIVSESSVVIGQWHTATLFRDGLNGWLRLDNDTPVSGRSQGQYSKITFRTPLFVGGAPSAYWLVRAVGTNRGFQGCVQSLSINSKPTDLRPWPRGNALSGADIGECSNSVCEEVTCTNGGVCFPTRADSYICLCPLGYRGVHCEESFLLALPQFNESLQSYASAPWPQSSHTYLSFMEFEIIFQPTNQDGTLLYSDDTASQDFLSINLVGGYVEFRFDCGSGSAVIRSEEPVSMNEWHELRVSRTAKNGILQVDEQRPVEGSSEGAFTQIKCSSPLYIGGVPDYDATKSSAGVLRAFSGAIQKITLNDRAVAVATGQAGGVNVLNALHPCVENPCANGGTCRPKRDGYDCDCALGYDGKHCQKECGNYCLNTVTEAIEIPQFTGRSYLTYDSRDILKRVSGSRTNVFMRFKSTSADGLLMWRGSNPMRANSDFLSVGLQDGSLMFSYNLGSGAAGIVVNGTSVMGSGTE
ncbi:hypothetical protein AOLI_G00273640 [Acnodon oligacanthus]